MGSIWSVAAVLLGLLAWLDGGLIWGFLVFASLVSLNYLHDISASLRALTRDLEATRKQDPPWPES